MESRIRKGFMAYTAKRFLFGPHRPSRFGYAWKHSKMLTSFSYDCFYMGKNNAFWSYGDGGTINVSLNPPRQKFLELTNPVVHPLATRSVPFRWQIGSLLLKGGAFSIGELEWVVAVSEVGWSLSGRGVTHHELALDWLEGWIDALRSGSL
jgi:hypothetical protein